MTNTKENENNIMSTESLKNILEIINDRGVNFFINTVAPNIRFTNENIVDLIREVVDYRLQNEGVSVSTNTEDEVEVEVDTEDDTEVDTEVDTEDESESVVDNMKKYDK